MKRTRQHQQGKGVFDLIEEATHLLRTASAATLAVYFIGAIPFVLGMLYFWADMSRSPLASEHLASASLTMAGLFVWMKFWQVMFAHRILAQAAGETVAPFKLQHGARILITQAIIQPTGLVMLPLALIPVLPFAWVYAFYQNITVLDDGTEAGTLALMKSARRQSALWPRQNLLLLAIMLSFAFCVFLNVATVCLTLPELFKLFFGVESVFTQSPYAMLNTTFVAAMIGLTYLCVDLVMKTLYALRCFYGGSLQSGEDLKTGLKPYVATMVKTATAIVIFVMVCSAPQVLADTADAPAKAPAGQSISPPELDRTIDQTIHESKYVWRMPRDQTIQTNSNDGVFAQFFKKVGSLFREWARGLMDWIHKILDKLFRRHEPAHVQTNGSGYGWIMSLQILLYGLVAAAVVALLVLAYRIWRAHGLPSPSMTGEAIQPVPDVADENVHADQLPEDGWTKLARELLERGEFRLAMRAFYLASLAHLAARNLISIARFKSNHDYERELGRRAHAFPELRAVFGNNISIFERIWYGMHEVNHDLVTHFAANLEKLKAGG